MTRVIELSSLSQRWTPDYEERADGWFAWDYPRLLVVYDPRELEVIDDEKDQSRTQQRISCCTA